MRNISAQVLGQVGTGQQEMSLEHPSCIAPCWTAPLYNTTVLQVEHGRRRNWASRGKWRIRPYIYFYIQILLLFFLQVNKRGLLQSEREKQFQRIVTTQESVWTFYFESFSILLQINQKLWNFVLLYLCSIIVIMLRQFEKFSKLNQIIIQLPSLFHFFCKPFIIVSLQKFLLV